MSARPGAGLGHKRGNSEHMSAQDNLESPARAVLLSRDSIEKLGVRRLAQLLLTEVTRNDGLLETLRKAISDHPRGEIVSPAELRRNEPVMVGSSPALLSVFKMIRKFAANEAPVLITGESGTGKELVAQAIHERSSYANGPFNPINCGSIPASLIASELFGHERGSFTGAHERKIGRIESAAGGTVFLDEIGELPLNLQANLLRFLQEKTIDRIGAQRPIKVDVRILAATNKNLAEEVRAGRFREDLYYRLNVLAINLPPLRARGDDIDLLCSYFLCQFAGEMRLPELRLSGAALSAIRAYSWPGNVRELISRLRRAAVMADSDEITAEDLDLPAPLGGCQPIAIEGGTRGAQANQDAVLAFHSDGSLLSLEEARCQVEELLMRQALERNAHNMTAAARQLGVSRVTLYRLIEKHGLRPAQANKTRKPKKGEDALHATFS